MSEVCYPPTNSFYRSTVRALFRKRSYVDENVNQLVLVQGRRNSSVVHAPLKYQRILHILSYRYEVFKHVLEVTTMVHVEMMNADTLHTRDMLFHLLHYLDDIREAYIMDASNNISATDWRCVNLEYFLWLDYTHGAYHQKARDLLLETFGVSFESMTAGTGPDIHKDIDWEKYLGEANKQFDMCGLEVQMDYRPLPVPRAARKYAEKLMVDLGLPRRGKRKRGRHGRGSKKTRGKGDEAGPRDHHDNNEEEEEPRARKRGRDDDDEFECDDGLNHGSEESVETTSSWETRFSGLYHFIHARMNDTHGIDVDDYCEAGDLDGFSRELDPSDTTSKGIVVFLKALLVHREDGREMRKFFDTVTEGRESSIRDTL